ncbi:MAG: HD-GYP domain-containing protein, partial [Vulcanimicrobiaceae bacterium]
SALERIVLATQALTVREWVPEPAVRVAQSDLVVTLLSTLESHDEGTSAHSRAVGAWCAQLAKLLGMTTPMQEFVSTCGMVHDIGKLVTPTEILLKPGALDDAEWVVMRAHAAAGAQMLERIPPLRETAGVVRAHHERIDGRGYPDQLSGDGIPLPARMVAVADAFHSMISTRPYRQALSIPAAIQIIRDGRGTQWDSGVVDAMLDYIVPKTSKGAASIGYAVGGFNTSSYW